MPSREPEPEPEPELPPGPPLRAIAPSRPLAPFSPICTVLSYNSRADSIDVGYSSGGGTAGQSPSEQLAWSVPWADVDAKQQRRAGGARKTVSLVRKSDRQYMLGIAEAQWASLQRRRATAQAASPRKKETFAGDERLWSEPSTNSPLCPRRSRLSLGRLPLADLHAEAATMHAGSQRACATATPLPPSPPPPSLAAALHCASPTPGERQGFGTAAVVDKTPLLLPTADAWVPRPSTRGGAHASSCRSPPSSSPSSPAAAAAADTSPLAPSSFTCRVNAEASSTSSISPRSPLYRSLRRAQQQQLRADAELVGGGGEPTSMHSLLRLLHCHRGTSMCSLLPLSDAAYKHLHNR